MNLPSSAKTEHRAINALENIIDEHLTMDHQFSSNDKEMSWDGYIWLYKNNDGTQSKENLEARVPVQIKGHNDRKRKYFEREKISYPVDLADLKAYATEKGVLYFQIFVDSKNRKEIYYSSLFPSKISDYLENAEKKRNILSINIPFLKLEKNADKLYVIVKQFNREAVCQGSVFNPLVQDKIRSIDFNKINIVSASIYGVEDEYSALLRLSSGDICLYGKIGDDKYPRPMEWIEGTRFSLDKIVQQSIGTGNDIYYESYKCVVNSDRSAIIILSPNLRINLTNTNISFRFEINTTIKELQHDARFLLRLKESKSLCIREYNYTLVDSGIDDGFKNVLMKIIDLYDTLKMINFDTNIIVSDLPEDKLKQLTKVVNMRLGLYNDKLNGLINRFDWKYGDKYFPLLVIKHDGGNQLESSIYTNKYIVALTEDGKTGRYKIPLFMCHDESVLGNLWSYDFDEFKRQIDNSDFNMITVNALVEGMLKIINVYDINSDENFLKLAQYILDKVEIFVSKELFQLNHMQIKKRQYGLTAQDIKLIRNLEETDDYSAFGKYVLLEEKDEALRYYEKFSKDERERYKKFPIYTLYTQL